MSWSRIKIVVQTACGEVESRGKPLDASKHRWFRGTAKDFPRENRKIWRLSSKEELLINMLMTDNAPD